MARTELAALTGLLERAKAEMMRSSQIAAKSSDWDLSHRTLQWAQTLDGMIIGLNGNGEPAGAAGIAMSPYKSPNEKLPRYYPKGDKLVKVGPSRDGTTYEHRVTREHIDLISDQLSALAAKRKTFHTPDLVKRCDVPVHEPAIILGVLEEKELVKKVRRGRWEFANAETFASDAQRVWSAFFRA